MFLPVAATKGLGERKASDSTESKDHDEHCKKILPLQLYKTMFHVCL